jgi:hypothetical protein
LPETVRRRVKAIDSLDLLTRLAETQRFEGASQFLLLLLAEKFGPLPEKVRQQVEAIDLPNRLAKLGARVLTAHSLEEMGLA